MFLALSTCSQTIRENGTYFVNAGYPEALNDTGTCQVTVHKTSPYICQFRYVNNKLLEGYQRHKL